MISTIKRLLKKVKEQAVNVPGYKAKKILRVYIYISITMDLSKVHFSKKTSKAPFRLKICDVKATGDANPTS